MDKHLILSCGSRGDCGGHHHHAKDHAGTGRMMMTTMRVMMMGTMSYSILVHYSTL